MTAASPTQRPDWTALTPEGKRDAVRPFLTTGLSAAKIAAHFQNCSRNALIGVLHRMKHGGETIPARGTGQPRKSRSRKSVANLSVRRPCRSAESRSDEISAPILPVEPKMIPLTALTEATCKWPYGDPREDDFGFCGHQSLIDGPYCAFHDRESRPHP